MEFNIVLVGDSGVGKSAYLNALQGRSFEPRWMPNASDKKETIKMRTSHGTYQLHITDCAGLNKYLSCIHEAHNDAVIYMFNVSSRISLQSLDSYMYHIVKSNGRIPSVLVGNGMDVSMENRMIRGKPAHPKSMEYFEVSSKTKQNIHLPLQSLLRKLTKHDDLVIYGASLPVEENARTTVAKTAIATPLRRSARLAVKNAGVVVNAGTKKTVPASTNSQSGLRRSPRLAKQSSAVMETCKQSLRLLETKRTRSRLNSYMQEFNTTTQKTIAQQKAKERVASASAPRRSPRFIASSHNSA
jgi:small GTP-binding protein